MRFNRAKGVLLACGVLGTAFIILLGCQGPAGPAGKDGLTLHDTLVIRDTVLKKDTMIIKDTTIIINRDTIITHDTTVKIDTVLMNSTCLSCHATVKMDSITTQYKMSFHFTRGVINNTSKYCAKCHTNEGFQETAANGLAAAQAAIPMATRIGCNTCHKMNGFDFVDTARSILRTTAPVVLNYNNQFSSTGAWTTQTATDLGAGMVQGGVNNLCGTCHQIRGPTSFGFTDTTTTVNGVPNPNKFAKKDSIAQFTQLPYFPVQFAPTGSVQYRNGRSFSVHDGNQMNLFLGKNAYEYPGVTYKGKDSASLHTHIKKNCVWCHLYTKFNAADSTGGHTFRPNLSDPKCKVCHDAVTPSGGLEAMMRTDSAAVKTLLNQLGELLTARKVFRKSTNATTGAVSYAAVPTHDFYGTLISPAAADSAIVYASTATFNNIDTTNGLLKYNNMIVWAKASTPANTGRLGRNWTGGELGAAYNYGFINSELSNGIHNPAYAKDVLQASIDWLTAHP